MTKEKTIKSALKFLVQKQTEQGSWGFSDDDDNVVTWNEVIEWLEQQPYIQKTTPVKPSCEERKGG